MDKKMKSLMENNVYELVELPKGCKQLEASGYVFKTKCANSLIERYEAQLVAQGCSQKFSINYD